jgi:hypothetical protein
MKLQTNDYTCGPVSLINAYYDKNKKYPRVTTRSLSYQCNTTESIGTYRWNLKKNTILSLPKETYQINKIMSMKNFILLYSFEKDYAHYVFVKKQNKSYFIFNYCDTETNDYKNIEMSANDFEDLLRKCSRIKEFDYPVAWEIL